jgi:hypothetical protein
MVAAGSPTDSNDDEVGEAAGAQAARAKVRVPARAIRKVLVFMASPPVALRFLGDSLIVAGLTFVTLR